MKEVKEEANKLKALSQVRAAIIKFFKLNSWQEAETKINLVQVFILKGCYDLR